MNSGALPIIIGILAMIVLMAFVGLIINKMGGGGSGGASAGASAGDTGASVDEL